MIEVIVVINNIFLDFLVGYGVGVVIFRKGGFFISDECVEYEF